MSRTDAFQLLEEYIAVAEPIDLAAGQALVAYVLNPDEETEAAYQTTMLAWQQLHADPDRFSRLQALVCQGTITDERLAWRLQRLYRQHATRQIPKSLMEAIINAQTELEGIFYGFEPNLGGKPITPNEVDQILATSAFPAECKAAWMAYRELGSLIGPKLLALVSLRNQAAHAAGFESFWHMRLWEQFIDPNEMLKLFEQIRQTTDKRGSFSRVRQFIDQRTAQQFLLDNGPQLPWFQGHYFGHQDPFGSTAMDKKLKIGDPVAIIERFYQSLGLNLKPILAVSDLDDRPGKNPHPECFIVGRSGDVRVICRMGKTWDWVAKGLHEFAHGLHFSHFDPLLPWDLRTANSNLAEAVALMMEGQTMHPQTLHYLCGHDHEIFQESWAAQVRQQHLLMRWCMVFSEFEKILYTHDIDDPDKLNAMWWELVWEYQGIIPPEDINGHYDWAMKPHHLDWDGAVTYQNYVVGFLAAAQIQSAIQRQLRLPGVSLVNDTRIGKWMVENLFIMGADKPWMQIVEDATGEPLNAQYWSDRWILV
ncbi:hypothetical protein KC571_01570 [candidate division WWE3 bacterium]|uniref:Peptidase M3A/M3B catalytic domain-containing protein n=1 Tax=candidate division WWE3 bacterium TaxID=2053526 RepID=A0A955LHW9_UNCKA|nr:hypothetical protein [candidate division WWE3 bacterium]